MQTYKKYDMLWLVTIVCFHLLPTFLFIKMRKRPLEFIIAYERSKDKKKAIEVYYFNDL